MTTWTMYYIVDGFNGAIGYIDEATMNEVIVAYNNEQKLIFSNTLGMQVRLNFRNVSYLYFYQNPDFSEG